VKKQGAAMAGRKQKIMLGIALAAAILAAFVAVWMAVPLLLIAVLLFAWGLEPKRTEEFVGRLPYVGNYVLRALAKLDSMLAG
jgi:hypothetical protein